MNVQGELQSRAKDQLSKIQTLCSSPVLPKLLGCRSLVHTEAQPVLLEREIKFSSV